MLKMSECCTCGYQWPTGQDGSHTCSVYMQKKIDEQKVEIAQLTDMLILVDVKAMDFGNGNYAIPEKTYRQVEKMVDGKKWSGLMI